jgi:hypothetical protein
VLYPEELLKEAPAMEAAGCMQLSHSDHNKENNLHPECALCSEGIRNDINPF